MTFKFFDKKSGFEANINKVLAQELHKTVIKRFKERKSMPSLKMIIGL